MSRPGSWLESPPAPPPCRSPSSLPAAPSPELAVCWPELLPGEPGVPGMPGIEADGVLGLPELGLPLLALWPLEPEELELLGELLLWELLELL